MPTFDSQLELSFHCLMPANLCCLPAQMMYYTNLWAMVLLAVALAVTGDGQRALSFVGQVSRRTHFHSEPRPPPACIPPGSVPSCR